MIAGEKGGVADSAEDSGPVARANEKLDICFLAEAVEGRNNRGRDGNI